LAVSWLGGCGATAKRVAAPDGSSAWRIDCSASVESDCRFEAERTCPAGYEVIASDDHGLTMRCRAGSSSPPPASPEAPEGDADAAERSSENAAQANAPASELPWPHRGVRHGFFARAGLGWGSSQASETLTDGREETLKGSGLAFDAAMGTAVSPIIMLGGTFAYQHVPSPTLTYGGRDSTATRDASISVLGFLVEAYAGKTSGLHFGGLLGYGAITAPDPYGVAATFHASGIGYGAEAGYHAPMGDRWHAGAKLRFLATATSYGTALRFEAQNTWALALMGDVMSL
jgi:hypothetical protein